MLDGLEEGTWVGAGLMLSYRDRRLRLGLSLVDGLAAGVCLLLAAGIRSSEPFSSLGVPGSLAPPDDVYLCAAIAVVLLPWVLRRCGAYAHQPGQGLGPLAGSLAAGCAFSAVGLLALGLTFGLEGLSASVVALYSATLAVALVTGRLMIFTGLREAQKRNRNAPTFVMIGSGPAAQRLAQRIAANPSWGMRNLGFLDDEPTSRDREILGARYLGRAKDLADLLARRVVDEVIVAPKPQELFSVSTGETVALCHAVRVDVTIASDLLGTSGAMLHNLLGVPALTSSHYQRRPLWALAVKRGMDILGAALGLVLTLPLWLLVAIAIRIESPGPVFLVQRRSGLRGRTFPLLKFRTMYPNAEARREALQEYNEVSGPVFKMKNDPRATRVGRFLRKYSVDELPQLINVLLGHMSLVGPRPAIPSEVSRYELAQHGRLSVRPGMTGLWQVSGRSLVSFEEGIRLDLQYLDEWSLLLDLRILARTVPAVLKAEGAS